MRPTCSEPANNSNTRTVEDDRVTFRPSPAQLPVGEGVNRLGGTPMKTVIGLPEWTRDPTLGTVRTINPGGPSVGTGAPSFNREARRTGCAWSAVSPTMSGTRISPPNSLGIGSVPGVTVGGKGAGDRTWDGTRWTERIATALAETTAPETTTSAAVRM